MTTTSIPEELMSRFRAVAMDRLERIDEAWTQLVRGDAEPDTEGKLLREVHTLKGDARVVGFGEASLLCQRLEDLLSAARSKGYRVHEDVDIVVTMTIQFISMLVRKRSSLRGGIDLDGFLKQIEEVMSEWLRRSSSAPDRKLSVGPHLRVKDNQRLTTTSGLRLSTAATSVYLEVLRTSGEPRERLAETWRSLLAGVNDAHRASLTPIVYGHLATARELASELGKRVTVAVDEVDVAVGPETAEAIGTVLLHALRNAVDHGIEMPTVRTQRGKPGVGTIRVRIERTGDVVSVEVQDDGAGIDVERARARCVERGLLSADVAPLAPVSQVLECLFSQGFSTRDAASDISGRGIGLDAAQAAVMAQGGDVCIESRPGAGTTLTAKILDVRGMINVTRFEGDSGIAFAVPPDFAARRTDASPGVCVEDVLCIPRTVSSGRGLELTGDGVSMVVHAMGKPVERVAHRRCPTPVGDLVEIVWIDDTEVVLIRPEVLHARLQAG